MPGALPHSANPVLQTRHERNEAKPEPTPSRPAVSWNNELCEESSDARHCDFANVHFTGRAIPGNPNCLGHLFTPPWSACDSLVLGIRPSEFFRFSGLGLRMCVHGRKCAFPKKRPVRTFSPIFAQKSTFSPKNAHPIGFR